MDSRWTKHGYTKEEVLAFRNAFDALQEILVTDFKKKEAVRDYSPGWEYKQIAVNEYNQSIEDVLKLITLTKG
jgi:hypothetical protein